MVEELKKTYNALGEFLDSIEANEDLKDLYCALVDTYLQLGELVQQNTKQDEEPE